MPFPLSVLRRRPRLGVSFLGSAYLALGLTFTHLGDVRAAPPLDPETCPAPLSAADSPVDGVTVLQGNLWMLPHRPLLLPYAFASDRDDRLRRLIQVVRTCRPQVVALQEVFEQSVVNALVRALPEYEPHTSGQRTAAGTVNTSGLLTLTRIPARHAQFSPFPDLPMDAKLIERMGRKGFLATEVATGDLRAVLVNAHLYSPRTPDEVALADEQLGTLLAFADSASTLERPVILVGDFNLDRAGLGARLGEGWTLSRHGFTYDPVRNPYTVRGANNTRGNHRDRLQGRGRRAVDFLALPARAGLRVYSRVVDRPLLSDHQFLAHRLTSGDRARTVSQ